MARALLARVHRARAAPGEDRRLVEPRTRLHACCISEDERVEIVVPGTLELGEARSIATPHARPELPQFGAPLTDEDPQFVRFLAQVPAPRLRRSIRRARARG